MILNNTAQRNLLLKQTRKKEFQKILVCPTMQVQIFYKKPLKLTKCFQIYLARRHCNILHKFKVKILLQKYGMLRRVNTRMNSIWMLIPIWLVWRFKKILVTIWAKIQDSLLELAVQHHLSEFLVEQPLQQTNLLMEAKAATIIIKASSTPKPVKIFK
jgi:hypothetical protein